MRLHEPHLLLGATVWPAHTRLADFQATFHLIDQPPDIIGIDTLEVPCSALSVLADATAVFKAERDALAWATVFSTYVWLFASLVILEQCSTHAVLHGKRWHLDATPEAQAHVISRRTRPHSVSPVGARQETLSRGCGARSGRVTMSSKPPSEEPSESTGGKAAGGNEAGGNGVRGDECDAAFDLTPLGPVASKLFSLLSDLFVVEDRDFVREESLNSKAGRNGESASPCPASPSPASSRSIGAGASKTPFAWGAGAEGDEALRLPKGVPAAERLGEESLQGEATRGKSGKPPAPYSPPLRDDQIKDAKKDPIVLFAVALIIVFQATGSLIGLTRELLPDELQGAAVMDEDSSRARGEVRDAPSFSRPQGCE